MPLRYIARVFQDARGQPLKVPMPNALQSVFGSDVRYKCEVARWWSADGSRNLVIGESTTWHTQYDGIVISQCPLCRKYGFAVNDTLEVLFTKRLIPRLQKTRGSLFREATETWVYDEEDLFPGRVAEELLYDPEKGDTTCQSGPHD